MVACKHLLPDKVNSKSKGDAFLAAVAVSMPEIELIDLSDCKDVTDVGLAKLMVACQHLLPDKVLSGSKGDAFLAAVVE